MMGVMIYFQNEKQTELEDKIKRSCQEGLRVENIEGKGRGVVATQNFSRGQFIVEYKGDLIDLPTAKQLENTYSR